MYPKDWGLYQKSIASFYRRRIRGNQAENLEKALAACQKALQVLTRETFPEEWAITQNTLGLVYSDRIKGDIAENKETAIACYKAALEVFTHEVSAIEWGRLQHNLGLAYNRRIKGNLRENQETAIAYYQAALEIRTREAFPEKWAQTQLGLGIVYSERLLGEPRENIDRAIAYYNAALEIYTPTLFPTKSTFVEKHLLAAQKFLDDLNQSGKEIAFILQIFKVIHNHILLPIFSEEFNSSYSIDGILEFDEKPAMGNLAGEKAFYAFISANLEKLDDNFIQLFRNWATVKLSTVDRYEAKIIERNVEIFSRLMQEFTQGNKAINLEIAITGYEILSSVFSGQENIDNQLLEAENLSNLSGAYRERIRGNKAENLEKAISLCETALKVFTRDNYPLLWASLQNNLGVAYIHRIKGEKADNLEKAISLCETALKVVTRDNDPLLWANLQIDLGIAYIHRIKGEKADNLEKAISLCETALKVFTRHNYPLSWAHLQIDLGTAYSERVRGDRLENLEKAIAYYQAALQVCTRDEFPELYGGAKMNLANAYRYRLSGNPIENLEIAIATYHNVLEVLTKEAFPETWAETQLGLGIVYSERLLGDPRENIDRAIAYYNAALEIYTPTLFPTKSTFVEKHLLAAQKFLDDLNQSGKEIAFILQIFQAIHNYILLPTFSGEFNPSIDGIREFSEVVYQADYGEKEELDARFIELLFNNKGFIKSRFDKLAMGNFAGEKAFYTFLSANLEKLDDNFIQLFRNWATVKLSTVDRYEAKSIEINVVLFSCLMQKFTQGNKAINLEIAITGHEILSSVFSGQENIFNQLLEAENLSNLSCAYRERIRGNKAENLEKAISLCETALKVFTRDNYLLLWANLQNNLGIAYIHRIKGEKADNLEKAISLCETALKVFTRHNYPLSWAHLQINLGVAYSERVRGDRLENLEKAIAYYQAALQVCTRDEFPELYGGAKMNLANAYRDRLNGNRIENLEIAIATYHNALEVLTKEAFPEKWARTQNNLGMAYSRRIRGNPVENQELAIKAYQAALQIYTEETFPQEWAMTQSNLGIIYSDLINGNPTENLEKAMTAYQAAARILTRDAFPERWAKMQYSMAATYIKLGKIDEAIACYQFALKIFTPTTFPIDCLLAGRLLGELCFKTNRWEEAIKAYGLAIEAAETSRSWITSESRRQAIMEKVIDVYFNMVQACINAGNLETALEYAERSKSKRLVDLMASNDLSQGGKISPEVQELLQQYDDLQQQIDLQHHQKSSDNDRPMTEVGARGNDRASLQAYNQTIANLESQKQQIWEQLRRLDPVLAGEIRVSAPDFPAMQKLIDKPTTAILSFYNTADNTYIFVLRQNQITIHTCSQQGIEILQPWIFESWLLPYLPGENETIQHRVERQSKWYDQMNSILAEVGERLQLDRLITEHLNGIEELILIPHLFLHLIPFGAIPISHSSHYFGDKFLIRYAPSCQILEFCHQRGEVEIETWQYGTVENAEDNLPCAGFEGEQISQLFNIPETNRLRGKTQATRPNYRQLANTVQLLHSCHHAESRLDNPLESVLKLGDGNITLGQLMTPGWRLPNLSDVFLSCCETGLGAPQLTDDILTLATGFLCAGARSVINTLWSVDDLATALVSIFYYQQRKVAKSRPEALWQAQMQLRGMKKEEVKKLSQPVGERRKEAKVNRDKYSQDSPEYQDGDREYRQYSSIYNKILYIQNENPFSDLRYWAGFVCQGL